MRTRMNSSFVGRGTYFNANDPQYTETGFSIGTSVNNQEVPRSMPLTTLNPAASRTSSNLSGFINEERERNRTMLQGLLHGNDPYNNTNQSQQYHDPQEFQRPAYLQHQQQQQQLDSKRSNSVFGSLRRLPITNSSPRSPEPPEQDIRFFNDQEEHQSVVSCTEEHHSPVVESIITEEEKSVEEIEEVAISEPTVYFKPWKKKQSNEEEEQTLTQQNKWRSRAIMNPFVKKKGSTSTFSQKKKMSPTDPEEETDTRNESIPLLSPRHLKEEMDHKTTRQDIRTPTPPSRNSIKAFRTEPEETVKNNAPTKSSPPHHLRRIQSFGGGKNQKNQKNNQNEEENVEENDEVIKRSSNSSSSREETYDFRPPVNPFQRSTALKALPLHTVSYSTTLEESIDSIEKKIIKPVRPSPPFLPVIPPKANHTTTTTTSVKSKVSTVHALAEIKRKREERRVLQAQEKERMITEVKEHGDDAGYKFRRLIQKYRDAICFLPTSTTTTSMSTTNTSTLSLPLLTACLTTTTTRRRTTTIEEINRLSVFIRKRPLGKKELKRKGYDIITCLVSSKQAQVAQGILRKELICHEPKLRVDLSETLENHSFQFDGVFDENEQNDIVYKQTVGPLMPLLIQNGNITVFAYGQTGSGKTYTMKSIYRQAANEIFEQLTNLYDTQAHTKQRYKYPQSVGVSFYEIYMNTVNDLLNGRKRLQLMEDADGLVQLIGLKEVSITNSEELLDLVQQGENTRATSANAVHDDSSRSHALLRITLYADKKMDPNEKISRLSMVDLAGSERACDTQTDSKNTRMEGAEINKSLLALKECIRALDRGATHIPFRQSKLTQLLRDSFMDTNSKTVMIATISPCSESCNHTLNTLRYADRLKEIGGGG